MQHDLYIMLAIFAIRWEDSEGDLTEALQTTAADAPILAAEWEKAKVGKWSLTNIGYYESEPQEFRDWIRNRMYAYEANLKVLHAPLDPVPPTPPLYPTPPVVPAAAELNVVKLLLSAINNGHIPISNKAK